LCAKTRDQRLEADLAVTELAQLALMIHGFRTKPSRLMLVLYWALCS
jgi:hypothetical protein